MHIKDITDYTLKIQTQLCVCTRILILETPLSGIITKSFVHGPLTLNEVPLSVSIDSEVKAFIISDQLTEMKPYEVFSPSHFPKDD